MSGRFVPPASGSSTPVRFPPMLRDRLANGLAVWTIPHATVPALTALLVIPRGTGDDPSDRHGLASLAGDLVDEGAGTRNAIEVADAFGRLGAELEIDVGPDATMLSVTGLARSCDDVLGLLADIVMRPHLDEADFQRVRELRLSRLRQLRRSAGAAADRTFVSALFGSHAYGHGALGTTASLEAVTADDAREFWATMYGPAEATLILGGAVDPREAGVVVRRAFGEWRDGRQAPTLPAPPDGLPDPRVLLVDRPSAPQSELRIGHVGPERSTAAYHAIVTVNALLGGQFTSRINRRLREEKGITYGARTSFDFRRAAGTFSCETSVQADATAAAVADVLAEFDDIRRADSVGAEELGRAKASLTRGYVRHFETAGQLVRAAAQLVTYSLDEGTFDRFVSGIDAVTAADVHQTAARFVRPQETTVVVVGDAEICRQRLESLDRPVVVVTPEF